MEKGNFNDLLFCQVFIVEEEFIVVFGYFIDLLEEQYSVVFGLLYKYCNWVLLLVKGGCVVNCCYCFCCYFFYVENQGIRCNWQIVMDYIVVYLQFDEIIFFGGDLLMVKDYEFDWLMIQLEVILYVKCLCIYSCLLIVILVCIIEMLVSCFQCLLLQVILVNYVNYVNEIDGEFCVVMVMLCQVGVMLFNQSVLLCGVNDNV